MHKCTDPICVVMVPLGKYRYHAVKKPYPTEVPIDPDFGYIDVESVVVQNEYIFVQVRFSDFVIASSRFDLAKHLIIFQHVSFHWNTYIFLV